MCDAQHLMLSFVLLILLSTVAGCQCHRPACGSAMKDGAAGGGLHASAGPTNRQPPIVSGETISRSEAREFALGYAAQRRLARMPFNEFAAADEGTENGEDRFLVFRLTRGEHYSEVSCVNMLVAPIGRTKPDCGDQGLTGAERALVDRLRSAERANELALVGDEDAAALVGEVFAVSVGWDAAPTWTRESRAADGGWLVSVWPGVLYEPTADGTAITARVISLPFVVHVAPDGRCRIVPP